MVLYTSAISALSLSLFLVNSLVPHSCSFSTDIQTWSVARAFPDKSKMSSKYISTSFLWFGTTVIIVSLFFFLLLLFCTVSHSLKTCYVTTTPATLRFVCIYKLFYRGGMKSFPLTLMHFSFLSTGGTV